jgi:hypothetical protein
MLLKAVLPAFVLAAVVGFALSSGGSGPSARADPLANAPAVDLGPVPAATARAVAGVPPPAGARGRGRGRGRVPAPPARDIGVYRGAGAWVDMYDPAELGNPWPALVEMRDNGVRTLYLETASWRVPKALDMKDEQAVELFLDEAHALGLKVVAWYLPGLDDLRTDLRRSRAVLDYRTASGGQGFDGFAIDIESQRVRPVSARNAALMRYSRALRRMAGPAYALGAITPDLRSTTAPPGLWPGFPYRATSRIYDVFLPMAYSSVRGHGSAYVYGYSRANVATVRALTGRPVHLIGGLSDALGPGEHSAVVRGARAGGAIGASFYDFAIGQDDAWRALRPYR